MVTPRDLARIVADSAADAVTLKISRVGGVERTRRLRDHAVDMRLGADIDTAATAHLMLSTPEECRLHTVDFMNWVDVANASGMPDTADGRLRAPAIAGLGVQVDEKLLGEMLFDAGE